MAHSRPKDGIGNQGDLVRGCLMASHFVYPCCAQDPRVQARYEAWLDHRELRPLVAYIHTFPSAVDAIYDLGARIGSWADAENRRDIEQAVADLGLTYSWLAPLLFVQFAAFVREAAGRPAERVLVHPTQVTWTSLPKPRGQPLHEAALRQAVEWYFRVTTHVDKRTAIYAEYARTRGRNREEIHAYVDSCLAQVHTFLSLLIVH
jgi:hypothetical protein